MQHQDDTADLPIGHDRRPHQRHRDGTAIQALNQLSVFAAALEATAENALNQGQAVFLGILIQQAEKCRQWQAVGLGSVPVGELLGGRVHVGDATFHVGGDHPVANRFKGDLRPLFFHLQGVGKGLTLGQQLA
ncbi:hypothetical protein D3C78_915060 [compost metagenome]